MTDHPENTAKAPIEAARDVLSVRRVFGEPYQHGDATIIPVAKFLGGSGMGFGGGTGPQYDDTPEGGEGFGGGGGFGAKARPVGVYVLRDGQVEFRPAFDLNRAILGAQIVAGVVALAIAWAHRGWFRWRISS